MLEDVPKFFFFFQADERGSATPTVNGKSGTRHSFQVVIYTSSTVSKALQKETSPSTDVPTAGAASIFDSLRAAEAFCIPHIIFQALFWGIASSEFGKTST
jgi:hypothetical protein